MPRYSRPPNTSLYIRNVSDGARAEEMREMFAKYGRIADVYVPVDYYTRRARGFAYVQFEHPKDAEDAMYGLDGTRFYGRELEIDFARGDRKTPGQMRGRDTYRRRSPHHRRSRSRSPRSRSRSPYYGGSRRRRSRSRSPGRSRRSKSPYHRRSRSRSHKRSRSPSHGRSPSRSRSRSHEKKAASKERHRSGSNENERGNSHSPRRSRSYSSNHSRSGSPAEENGKRDRSRSRS